jgi:16S rRNA (adenine1518-N6/adenine1519-N6)-dimethyltransferase
LEIEDPRILLRKYGLRPKARYSQNFLVSRPVVEALADAIVRGGSTGRVVEFGAGTGVLTAHLLARGLEVIAIEPDPDMVQILESEWGGNPNLRIVAEDATELDLATLGLDPAHLPTVVGNLPYAITGPILRWACDNRARVRRCIFMVQKEVGERLGAAASTPTYGALTVFVQNHFNVTPLQRISAGAFFPRPKVDSQVICLEPRPSPISPEDAAFRAVVRAAFDARRKTLRNALCLHLVTGAQADAILSAAGIDGKRRGETLDGSEFALLARTVADHTGLR